MASLDTDACRWLEDTFRFPFTDFTALLQFMPFVLVFIGGTLVGYRFVYHRIYDRRKEPEYISITNTVSSPSGEPLARGGEEYERETGQGDVLGGNNDVVHTTVKHNFHAVTSGDSLTFTECSPSSPLSRESPSTVEPPPTTEMFSISNGVDDRNSCPTEAKRTTRFIELFWLIPAADQLCDVLTLCDKSVSLDFLQHCSVHATSDRLAHGVSHLTETIHYFGNGILQSYLLPHLESNDRIKTCESEGRQTVAIKDQQIRDIVSCPPSALPTTGRYRDAARLLYLLLLEGMKMKDTPLSLHRETLEHASYFLSLARSVKGLLTPMSLVHLTLRMVEPLAKFKTLAEADACAAHCLALLLSYATPQLSLPLQMDPCLYRMYLVDAAVARARQQRHLGNPKASLELLDTAESLQSEIRSMNGGNYMTPRIKVARAEALSYWGHYREALFCLQDMEETVSSSNDATDQYQYCLTRAGICYYLKDYEQSNRYYENAIRCVEGGDNDQTALVLSLAARVPASLQARNGLGPEGRRLDKAEQRCGAARKLLRCYENSHRYWGVLERSYAMIYVARATQTPEHTKSGVLLQAVQHASNALECLSSVYGPKNVNVAMTLEILGQIAAMAASRIPKRDKYIQVVVDRLTQKYLEIASVQPQCTSRISSVRDLSWFCYRQAVDLYQDCSNHVHHPACLIIHSAMGQLS